MGKVQELIEQPLTSEELAVRYRALCEDPCFANVPGKIEVDVWGRLLMSPASNYHSACKPGCAKGSPSSAARSSLRLRSSLRSAYVWIAYPQSKRWEFYGKQGLLEPSSFNVGLSRLFD